MLVGRNQTEEKAPDAPGGAPLSGIDLELYRVVPAMGVHMRSGITAAALLVLACATSVSLSAQQSGAPQQSAQETNPRGAATKAFLDRMQEYATFHNNVEKMVPSLKETASPEEIARREAALAEALIKQRPHAKPGDFLIPQYQPYLIEIIEQDFAKRPPADRKALVVELPKGMKIGVNMIYPTSLPLATFPANLLQKLPALPDVLEYRIVGRHLILRDVKGSVIVDVMRDVFPIPR